MPDGRESLCQAAGGGASRDITPPLGGVCAWDTGSWVVVSTVTASGGGLEKLAIMSRSMKPRVFSSASRAHCFLETCRMRACEVIGIARRTRKNKLIKVGVDIVSGGV